MPFCRRGRQQRCRVIDIAGERRLEALEFDAEAERDAVAGLPRHGRVDIDRLDLGLEPLEAADPAVVVFGDQAEGRIDAHADRPLFVERHRQVEIWHEIQTAGIAAVVAQRLLGRSLRRPIAELHRGLDQVQRSRHLARAQSGHARCIGPHGRSILRGRGAAGIGIAEAAGGVFLHAKPAPKPGPATSVPTTATAATATLLSLGTGDLRIMHLLLPLHRPKTSG